MTKFKRKAKIIGTYTSLRKKRFLLLLYSIIFIILFSSSISAEVYTSISKKQSILKNFVICIDPGHQKKANNATEPVAPNSTIRKAKTSSGTSGIFTGIPEYSLNLQVALMLKSELEALGAKIIMTRTKNDVDISNIERAEIANKTKANLFIRIHADGSANNKINGISVLIPGDKYIKNKKLLSESKKAGQDILNSVISSTKANSRGLSIRNDLTGFNWSKVPVVLIEMGFMTNKEEDIKLSQKEYRQKLVNGMVQGIIKYSISQTKKET